MLRVAGVLLVVIFLAGVVWYRLQMPIPDAPPTGDAYRLESRDCGFAPPEDADITCLELHTPPSSGYYRLPVVILRDTTAQRRPDPVIYLQGGPGSAAGLDEEGIAYWRSWLRGTGMARDLVLMDPRGTGLSKPQLACAGYDRYSLRALRENLTLEQELAQGYDVLAQCFSTLRNSGFSPEHFGTQISADDVHGLMQTLSQLNPEYQQWNLLGVSYGSRLAMAAASNNTQVRALILDSVYPPGYGGVHSWPAVLDQALHRFFLWCETHHDCNPDGRQHLLAYLEQVLERLRDRPLDFTVARWDGEAPVNLKLNDHRFLSAVFSASYGRYDWVHIVPAMDGVMGGNRAQLNTLVESFINNALSQQFNGLVFMAVDCRDHELLPEADYQRELALYPVFAEYTRDFWRYQACHFLPVADRGLTIDPMPQQPALLLSGALDPITPPEWAEALHQHWPGSQWLVFDDLGHAVINHQSCMYQSLGRFLDDPQTDISECREQ